MFLFKSYEIAVNILDNTLECLLSGVVGGAIYNSLCVYAESLHCGQTGEGVI